MLKKISVLLSKLIMLAMALLYAVVIVNTIRDMRSAFAYASAKAFYLYAAIGAAAVAVCVCAALLCVRKRLYRFRWVWLLAAGMVVAGQLLFMHTMKLTAMWDSLNVTAEAQRMVREADGHISAQGVYFEMYGNNYFMVLILHFFYRLLALLGVSDVWPASQLLNLVLMDGGIALCCLTLYRLRSTKAAFSALLLWLINPCTYIYVTWVYTNTFSIASIGLELFLACQLYRAVMNGKRFSSYVYAAALGVTAVLSFYLRATNLIVMIACAACAILYLLYSSRNAAKLVRRALPAAAALVVACVAAVGGYSALEGKYVSPEMKEKNFPLIHWVAMGLNPESSGVFAQEDETDSIAAATMQQRTAIAKQKISQRLRYLLSTGKIISHFNNKLRVLWSNGEFYFQHHLNVNNSYAAAYRYVVGENSSPFRAFVQLSRLLSYVLVLSMCIRLLLSKRIDFARMLMLILLLGVNMFYMLWEVSAVYFVCFLPIYAMLGGMELDDGIKQHISLKKGAIALAVAAVMLVVIPWKPVSNGTVDYGNRCISGHSRRTELEGAVDTLSRDGARLVQSFEISTGKAFNTIDLLVQTLDAQIGCVYHFRLSNEQSGELIYETDFEQTQPKKWLYFHSFAMPQTLGAGRYVMEITAAQPGSEDDLSFIYALREMTDFNPRGNLTISGDELSGRADLLLNVYMAP